MNESARRIGKEESPEAKFLLNMLSQVESGETRQVLESIILKLDVATELNNSLEYYKKTLEETQSKMVRMRSEMGLLEIIAAQAKAIHWNRLDFFRDK